MLTKKYIVYFLHELNILSSECVLSSRLVQSTITKQPYLFIIGAGRVSITKKVLY